MHGIKWCLSDWLPSASLSLQYTVMLERLLLLFTGHHGTFSESVMFYFQSKLWRDVKLGDLHFLRICKMRKCRNQIKFQIQLYFHNVRYFSLFSYRLPPHNISTPGRKSNVAIKADTHYPCSWPVFTARVQGHRYTLPVFTARVGPWTRVMCIGLKD